MAKALASECKLLWRALSDRTWRVAQDHDAIACLLKVETGFSYKDMRILKAKSKTSEYQGFRFAIEQSGGTVVRESKSIFSRKIPHNRSQATEAGFHLLRF